MKPFKRLQTLFCRQLAPFLSFHFGAFAAVVAVLRYVSGLPIVFVNKLLLRFSLIFFCELVAEIIFEFATDGGLAI